MTRFYLVNFILSLLVLQNFGRDFDFRLEEPAALQNEGARRVSSERHRPHKNSGHKQGVVMNNGLHRRPVGLQSMGTASSTTIISRCQSGGLCISSGGCPVNRVLQDEMGCLMEHNNYVCCHVDRKRMPINVFLDNQYD